MRDIKKIIVHCAATYPTMDIGVKEIRKWHVEENNWPDIAYHYVIRRSGEIELGRPIWQVGTHTANHNGDSIGICLVGGLEKLPGGRSIGQANFTVAQYAALDTLLCELKAQFPIARIRGHSDYAPGRACPCFEVAQWCAERDIPAL